MARLGRLFGRVIGAPVRALLPSNPWLRLLVIALPVLVLLAFLQPVLGLVGGAFQLVAGLLAPLLDNAVGRLVLLNAILAVVALVAWLLLRNSFRSLRSGLLLRHHLDGVQALLGDDRRRPEEAFRRAARSTAAPPREYRAAPQDARIKLARLALERDEPAEAIAWLTRVREKRLPAELRRSLLQLRVEAAEVQGEMLPETVEREVVEALERFADDAHLLAALRRLLIARGALAEAADVQARLLAAAAPRAAAAARQQLLDDLIRAGEQALEGGDPQAAAGFARRAHAVEATPAAGVLLGRAMLASGDVTAAVREWGAVRAPEGLARLAELFDERPGVLSPRQLLQACPTQGALLLVAREYARAGEPVKALRAARRAARALGPTPTVTAVLGEVLERCGQTAEAAELRQSALRLAVGGEAPA